MIGIFWLGGGGVAQSPYQFFHYDLMTEWPLFFFSPPFRRLTGSLSQAAAAVVTLRSPDVVMLGSCGRFFFLYKFFLTQSDQLLSAIGGPSRQTRDTVFGLDNRPPP